MPIYDPTVVYGPWWYPAYPPYYWYPPGYVVRAHVLAFGLGVAVGAALWGGFDWGHHSVHINVDHLQHLQPDHHHEPHLAARRGPPPGRPLL